MRISDWSSDVCSSDLVRHAGAGGDRARQHAPGFGHPGAAVGTIYTGLLGLLALTAVVLWQSQKWVERRITAPERRAAVPAGARKSVAEGKQGSVSVDSGGCRSIKKTKNRKKQK